MELSPWMLVISGAAIGGVGIVREAFPQIPKRMIPLLVLVACGGGALLIPDLTWKIALLNGLIGGLSATGAYSSQKALKGK